MGYIVRMPQLGMTMEEGIVVEWTVDVGEEFKEGDVIAVVESEKTTNDVKAREDGRIVERLVTTEEPIEPGDPIAYVGKEGDTVPNNITVESDIEKEEISDHTTEHSSTKDTAQIETITAADNDKRISPRARSYVQENNITEIPLGDLSGSGPKGAVIEQDIIDVAEEITTNESTPTGSQMMGEEMTSISGRDIYEELGDSGLRRTIADRMTKSAEAPQVTLNRRADVDALLEVKNRLETDRDLTLSVSDFLLAAVVDAIEEYPALNGIYEDGIHKLARNVNLGIAVDIDEGLVTPVISSANDRSITELRAERQRLVSLVQSGEYTMDDLSDGTFTVTNLGHFGVETFDPLLNPPQVAILGVGEINTSYDPEVDEPRKEIGLSLTFDHRALDGADAARFLASVADALEHPLRLVTFGHNHGQSKPFMETEEGPKDKRTATVQSEGGMQAAVRSQHFKWAVDEPEDKGGENTAPSPVEQFVGSLASCLTLMIGHMADRREIDLDDVTVTAKAQPPEGRIKRIDVDVTVVSDAGQGEVKQVVDLAERACYVNQVIDPDIDRDVDITIK